MAYHERGCVAFAVELWDLFAAAGLQKRQPFYLNYSLQDLDTFDRLIAWDLKHNAGRSFAKWVPIKHPQLGSAEIGGIDPLRGFFKSTSSPYSGHRSRRDIVSNDISGASSSSGGSPSKSPMSKKIVIA